MGRKIRVGVLCGGKSAEHEVSLQSAKNIVEAIDRGKYDVLLIGIDKRGQWHITETSDFLLHADDPRGIELKGADDTVTLIPGRRAEQLVRLSGSPPVGPVDVVFPVLHGPFGEDGTVQGLFKLVDVPFVGSSVLGSAAAMDKDITKRLLRDAGVPIAKFLVFDSPSAKNIDFIDVERYLGLPFFVKPANLGSSVGVNKVDGRERFSHAIAEAFEYDNKILIEEFKRGREIECSVLGNDEPIASVPGEVIPRHEFYSYEAKYIDESGAILEIPAKLGERTINQVQELAVKTFKVLCCEGMARVDFFVNDKEIIVNELNTIPGFTRISMYPKLWEASGISYTELIDRLIDLALERFEKEKKLRTSIRTV